MRNGIVRKAGITALGGALAFALAPGLVAPQAFADEAGVNAVKAIVDVYGVAGEVTADSAQNVTDALAAYSVELSELPTEYQNYVLRCQLFESQADLEAVSTELSSAKTQNTSLQGKVTTLQKQLDTANATITSLETTALSKVKVSSLKATASGMGKVALSWKAKNGIDGMRYEIRYSTGTGAVATKTTKALKKTIKKLKGGKTYTFQVLAYKKLSGKRVYSAASKKATAKVIRTYAKGSYKVKADLLHVRKKASASSALLVDALKGAKLKVTKVKVVNATVWGKVSYGGKTGWVQMQYLKKA